MNDHIGDDAELYALGLFDPARSEAIEAHLAMCGACSHAVGEAERVALALVESAPAPSTSLPQAIARARRAPMPIAWLSAAASLALSVGLGAALVDQHARLVRVAGDDDVAFATIATSHFLHASFVPSVHGVPPSKVLYARDSAWAYVIVDGIAENWRVVGATGKNPGVAPAAIVVGTLHSRGATSVVFAHPSRRFQTLQLQDSGGRTMATAHLTYPRANP